MANEHSQIVPSMQPTAKVADFKFWCQKVLPLVYDDSLSYYEVLNKMVVYLNQVIDNINADIDNVEELEDDFLLLQEYVNNFFDDIDQLVTYTERAEAAQTAAATSAINAATSASNSATSASNSAGSASSAATSALSALDAKDAAVAAKTAAETALVNAQTAATNAAASATAASGSATNAAASATAAQNSFTLADAARSAAQSAASSAESDAEDAADSAAEAAAAVDTIVNGLGTIAKTIENVPVASVDDALASIAKKLVVDIVPVQSGSGDPSPTNVRPITGWTEVNVKAANENICPNIPRVAKDAEFTSATLSDATLNGLPAQKVTVVGTSTSWGWRFMWQNSRNFLKPSTTYTIEFYTDFEQSLMQVLLSNTGGQHRLAPQLNCTKTKIGDIYKYTGTFTTYDATNDAWNYSDQNLMFYSNVNNYEGVYTYSNAMLVAGDKVPNNYVENNTNTYNIELPVDAGTVYGCTLTYENGEWKLRVEMGIQNLGDLTWSAHPTYGFYSGGLKTVIKPPSGNAFPVIALCSNYKIVAQVNESTTNYCLACDTGGLIYVNDNNYSDAATFKTAMSGVQLVYELANPIDYTLTESQALTLLNGINNVWADTGNINTLEYFTNAENYVTSQIDLAKALIAPVLKEMKADTALVANDFRIVGNTLYRITGNIASGGTLTPNTNCVATTVGEILKSLLSA